MPHLSRVRLIRGQGGSTLIELLVAMPMAVMLLGLVTQALVTGSQDQRRLERRTAALNLTQIGLERMTRELRQAAWVYFRSSQVVDAEVMVRPDPGSRARARHVRYECMAGACWRYEGPAVPFPPPPVSALETARVVIGSRPGDAESDAGRLIGQDVFFPKTVDPASGAAAIDYLTPNLLHIRVRIAMRGLIQPLEIADGVSLRNATRFADRGTP